MKKLLLMFFILQLLLCSKSLDANHHNKIVGNWLCEGFFIENDLFKAEGIGEVSYSALKDTLAHLRYSFDFGEGKTLKLDLKLSGEWGYDKKGFWDKLKNTKVSIASSNLNLSDERIKEIINNYFPLNKMFYSNLVFGNDDKFILTPENGLEPVVCIRDIEVL